MKVSELIKILQDLKDKHGDLPVWVMHEWEEELEQTDNFWSGIHYIQGGNYDGAFPDRIEISSG